MAVWKHAQVQTANRNLAVCGFFFLIIVYAALLPAGCAPRTVTEVRDGLEERGHYIDSVPFYRQADDDCGPAALAGVLEYHGYSVGIEQVRERILTEALRGTLPPDMENYARDAGFRTEALSGTFEGLKDVLRSNLPVICLIDLGHGPYRRPHYVTLLGFDDGNRLMIMHNGVRPGSLMSYGRFLKAWDRAGSWMLVIRPAGAPE